MPNTSLRTPDRTGAEIAALLRERFDTVRTSSSWGGNGCDRRLHPADEGVCDIEEGLDSNTKDIATWPPGYLGWCPRCAARLLDPADVFDADPPAELTEAHFYNMEIQQ